MIDTVVTILISVITAISGGFADGYFKDVVVNT